MLIRWLLDSEEQDERCFGSGSGSRRADDQLKEKNIPDPDSEPDQDNPKGLDTDTWFMDPNHWLSCCYVLGVLEFELLKIVLIFYLK